MLELKEDCEHVDLNYGVDPEAEALDTPARAAAAESVSAESVSERQSNSAVQPAAVENSPAQDGQTSSSTSLPFRVDPQLGKVAEKLEGTESCASGRRCQYASASSTVNASASTVYASEERQEPFSGTSSMAVGPRGFPYMEEESAQYYARLIAQALTGIMSENLSQLVEKQLFDRFAESLDKIVDSVAERTATSCAAMIREVSSKSSPRSRSPQHRPISPPGDVFETFSAKSSHSSKTKAETQHSPTHRSPKHPKVENLFRSSASNGSSCNSRNSSAYSRPAIGANSIQDSQESMLPDANVRGTGVKQLEASIGNKLLEAMDLCAAPSLKVGMGGAKAKRSSSQASFCLGDGIPAMSRQSTPSVVGYSPRRTLRSSFMDLFRRSSIANCPASHEDNFILSDLKVPPGILTEEEISAKTSKGQTNSKEPFAGQMDPFHLGTSGSSKDPGNPQFPSEDTIAAALPAIEAQQSAIGLEREQRPSQEWGSFHPSSQRTSILSGAYSARMEVSNRTTGETAQSRFSSMDNMAKLRRLRTNELVEDMRGSVETMDMLDLENSHGFSAHEEWSDDNFHSVRPIHYLRAWGIIGWRSLEISDDWSLCTFAALYQWIVFALTLVGLGVCIVQVLRSRAEEKLCYSDACLRLGLLTDIPLFVGAAVGLVALGTYAGSKSLSECIGILINYGNLQGFLQSWERLMWRDLILISLIWVIAVLERFRGTGTLQAAQDGTLDAWGMLHMTLFTMSTGVLLGLTFCILCFCHGFTTMVDSFCASVAAKGNLQNAVGNWNILQAVLRKSSAVIECCFFVLQTTAFSTILIGVADVVHSLASQDDHLLITLIPCVLVTFGVATIFFSAAKVTEKCAHVPSLVNSMSFGLEIDHERQYVVEYIMHSAAGFYVFEVRLTSAMSLKFAYFCIVAAFTMTTWLSTQFE